MASSSNSTLASLWDDGQSSPISTPTKSLDLNDEMVQFCKETGLVSLAKESVIEGETSLPQKAIQMVAIPVSGTPIKVEPAQIITKSTGHTGSPMLMGTPQRVMSASQLMQSPARTPSMVAPVAVESPSWTAGNSGRKRTTEYLDVTSLYLENTESKRTKKQEKGGKGLRHFSMKVCEKVQKKGVTSYNEVADELVAEFSDPRNLSPTDQQYDQKNIRRRVYDALNVLMAMNIISKEKKEIRWIGLPTNSAQECQNLEFEKKKKLDRIKQKTQQLQELILQQIAFKNLVQRNKHIQTTQGPPQANSAIQLPFIIVNTSKKTVIDCSISNDKYEYLFNFDNTFEIHDDIEVLKRMRMAYGLEKGQCGIEDVKKAAKLVPKALEPYVYDLANVKAPNLSITAGPSGLQTGTTHLTQSQQSRIKGAAQSLLSSTALPAHLTQEQTNDMEVAMATHGLSRQSSIGSYSDAGPSNMDSPADAFSEPSDSERSSPVDMM